MFVIYLVISIVNNTVFCFQFYIFNKYLSILYSGGGEEDFNVCQCQTGAYYIISETSQAQSLKSPKQCMTRHPNNSYPSLDVP
jgi:hypothetical protein